VRTLALLLGISLTATSLGAAAQGLGRLFTTPEQRAELNNIRNDPNWGVVETAQQEQIEITPTGPVVPHVTINGVVFRSSGLNASWINGLSIPSSDATREGIRVQTRQLRGGGTVQLSMPGGLETVEIKPGQKIDLRSGGVFEPYELQADDDASLFEEIPITTGIDEPGATELESLGGDG
jgi:hypothetical protein